VNAAFSSARDALRCPMPKPSSATSQRVLGEMRISEGFALVGKVSIERTPMAQMLADVWIAKA
jgi:hypothetical protein